MSSVGEGFPVSDQASTSDRRTSYGSVLADREYRVIFAASGLSWIGDYLARAAVTLVVYSITQSAAQAALTFAISFLPWLAGGPVLAALAERYPLRRVMVFCDLARAVLIGCVIIHGMPVWGMWLLLFAAALLNPPFDASRSALLSHVLSGDRYVLATSIQSTSQQFALLVGYGPGPALAAYKPWLALLLDSATFLASAVLIWTGVHHRQAFAAERERKRLLSETADGFRYILASPVLRSVALVVMLLVAVTNVPEGLAIGWASRLPHPAGGIALAQALIMGSNPVGQLVGSFAVNRLVPPDRRAPLLPVLAVLGPLALVPALAHPNVPVIALCAMVSGFATGALLPNAIGIFARVVISTFRARVFGVMQTSVVLSQAVGILATGDLADRYDLPTVVGLWSAVGTLAMLLVCVTLWPRPERVDREARQAAVLAGQVPAQDSQRREPAPTANANAEA